MPGTPALQSKFSPFVPVENFPDDLTDSVCIPSADSAVKTILDLCTLSDGPLQRQVSFLPRGTLRQTHAENAEPESSLSVTARSQSKIFQMHFSADSAVKTLLDSVYPVRWSVQRQVSFLPRGTLRQRHAENAEPESSLSVTARSQSKIFQMHFSADSACIPLCGLCG